uniref:Uncharacterized protein n=1 Tax=Rousettus aegyptiacus TaxID=9407 RepID=A0A7J8CIS7_ROUAE|nr:hypothetical protein HJG63_009212 [Rousettus aegyptiacus]
MEGRGWGGRQGSLAPTCAQDALAAPPPLLPPPGACRSSDSVAQAECQIGTRVWPPAWASPCLSQTRDGSPLGQGECNLPTTELAWGSCCKGPGSPSRPAGLGMKAEDGRPGQPTSRNVSIHLSCPCRSHGLSHRAASVPPWNLTSASPPLATALLHGRAHRLSTYCIPARHATGQSKKESGLRSERWHPKRGRRWRCGLSILVSTSGPAVCKMPRFPGEERDAFVRLHNRGIRTQLFWSCPLFHDAE